MSRGISLDKTEKIGMWRQHWSERIIITKKRKKKMKNKINK